jgi:hypothetical protein
LSDRCQRVTAPRPIIIAAAALKNARDRTVEAADYARKSSAIPVQIDPVAIDRFTRLMREQLISNDVAALKAYLASIVDAVIVSEDKIRIIGWNDNIRSTFGPKGQPTLAVRKSHQKRCPTLSKNANTYVIEISI